MNALDRKSLLFQAAGDVLSVGGFVLAYLATPLAGYGLVLAVNGVHVLLDVGLFDVGEAAKRTLPGPPGPTCSWVSHPRHHHEI